MKRGFVLVTEALILAAIFSWSYVNSVGVLPASLVAEPLSPAIEAVFRSRLLMPFLLRHLFSQGLLDSQTMRLIAALISATLLLALTYPFARRLGAAPASARWMPLLTFLLLVLHYCLPRVLNVYYCYDLPAILFYLAIFLLLTDPRRPVFLAGALLAVLLVANRETIAVAVFHALGFFWARREAGLPWRRLAGLAATLAAVALVRLLMVRWVGGAPDQSVSLYEDGVFRPLANLHHLAEQRAFLFQTIMLGAGMVFWLIPAIVTAGSRERWMIAASAVPMGCLMVAGNFAELRIYGEMLPLMGFLLIGLVERTLSDPLDAPSLRP